MSRNTKIALGIGALAIVGYVFFKRYQAKKNVDVPHKGDTDFQRTN